MRAPRGEAAALQVRGHAPRLVQHLGPGVVDHAALAERLGQVDAVGLARLVVEHVVEDQGGWSSSSSAGGVVMGSAASMHCSATRADAVAGD